MMNILSECRSANIVRDHAMILSDDATPKPDEIFGKDKIEAPSSPRGRKTSNDALLSFGAVSPPCAHLSIRKLSSAPS
jgi:hypothetical protein